MPIGSGDASKSVHTKPKGAELMPATLKIHRFTLILGGFAEKTDDEFDNAFDDLANTLYGAGCDDAGVGSCEGVVSVAFDREAESLGDAIGSAVKDVERAGFAVARVDVENA
jgi:hypothetical protein